MTRASAGQPGPFAPGVAPGPGDPRPQADLAPALDGGRPLISVVVPAYNEAALITQSLTSLCDYLARIEDMYRWELIVVNDGSTDETGALAEAFASGRPDVRVLHHHVNFHLGQALRYAFRNCRGDYVVSLDCDLSYAPEHIGRLVSELRSTRAKIVIASPYLRGGRITNVPFRRRVLSKGGNRFLSIMAKGRISTLTGMVRAYDRRFLSSLNLKSMDTEINTEILYKAELLGAVVKEIPAHLDWSFNDTGKPRRRIAGSLRSSARSYLFSGFMFRPVFFFIVPGLLTLALATYTLGWVFWRVTDNYLNRTSGGFDPRLSEAVRLSFESAPHAFIVGGIALLVAFQLISLGVLALQSERYFHELFHFNTSIYRELRSPGRSSTTDGKSQGERGAHLHPVDAQPD
ncbi:MAG: glycosyltransferase family 2 protein [Acidimicrobiales bacterium]